MKAVLTVMLTPLIFVAIILVALSLLPFMMVAMAFDVTGQKESKVYDLCDRYITAVMDWRR